MLSRLPDALRLALGTLTILPVPPPRSVTGRTPGLAMAMAPLVGGLLGGLAALVACIAWALGASPAVCALLAVAALAWLTRGLHLDGLADTADGLGCGRTGAGALEVMRRSDVGPFGVTALLLALLLQAAALTSVAGQGLSHAHGSAALAMALVVGTASARAALPLATRRGWPAARAQGLGATVASSVPFGGWLAAGLGAVLAAVVGSPAPVIGLLSAQWLLRRTRARLGGVTGDVLGACVELAATVTLVCLGLPRLELPWPGS